MESVKGEDEPKCLLWRSYQRARACDIYDFHSRVLSKVCLGFFSLGTWLLSRNSRKGRNLPWARGIIYGGVSVWTTPDTVTTVKQA